MVNALVKTGRRKLCYVGAKLHNAEGFKTNKALSLLYRDKPLRNINGHSERQVCETKASRMSTQRNISDRSGD